MTDSDHNAFLDMYEHMECENPFDQEIAWIWEDWEDEEHPEYWGI